MSWAGRNIAHFTFSFFSVETQIFAFLRLFRGFLGLSLLLTQNIFAQIQLLKQIPIAEPQAVSMDIYGNIFLADLQGNITHYNENGDSIRRFAPEQPATIHILEAWKGLKILAFYKDLQRFTWLNRFLTPTETYTLHSEQIGFARLLNYSNDGYVWIFDDQDFSLKKYDFRNQQVLVRTPCDLLFPAQNYQITFLREYQNQVFLVDKNFGIFFFDNFGNFKKNLQIRNINFINFWGEHIAYLQEKTLYLQHLYKRNVERKISLPIEHNYKDFFLLTSTRIYLFTTNRMFIYTFQ
jgi:hypothetical protein